jgi:hypothetical protein
MIDAATLREYRRIRAGEPAIGARQALIIARYERRIAAGPVLDWRERGDKLTAEPIRHGAFELVLDAVADWDVDYSWLGELRESGRDGSRPAGAVCKVREYHRGELLWYVPAYSNGQGPASIAAGWRGVYARGPAYELAMRSCRRDAAQLIEGSAWILRARVYVNGEELGHDSIGGYTFAPEDRGERLFALIEEGIREHGLAECAMREAREQLERLAEIHEQRAADAAEAAFRELLPE